MKKIKDCTVDELRESFAKGTYVPGAGSLAALAGSYSAALLHAAVAVNRKNHKRKACKLSKDELDAAQQETSDFSKKLLELCQEDNDLFKMVGDAREERRKLKKGSAEHQEINSKAQTAVQNACPALENVVDAAIALIKVAEKLASNGVFWVGGDCAVAAQVAAGAARGAIETLRLNTFTLREFDEKWCKQQCEKIERFEKQVAQALNSMPRAKCFEGQKK